MAWKNVDLVVNWWEKIGDSSINFNFFVFSTLSSVGVPLGKHITCNTSTYLVGWLQVPGLHHWQLQLYGWPWTIGWSGR